METSSEIVAPPPGRASAEVVPRTHTSLPPFAKMDGARTVPPRPERPADERAEDPPRDRAAALPTDASPFLASLVDGDDAATSARRAGAGLLLTLPFAIAAGLRTDASPTDALVAALGLPVGLALIALVGVASSTLGISIVSAPLEPSIAGAVASRGLLRAGLLLAGLAPLTALWVASGSAIEALFATTLVTFVAGAAGIGAIAHGLVTSTKDADGSPRLGSLVVSTLFVLFAFLVGLRVWVSVVNVLSPELFGGME